MSTNLLLYLTLLGLRDVLKDTRLGRSTFYQQKAQGLWPQPVCVGPRAKAWSAGEIAAVKAARVAGQSDDEIRALVRALHAQRQKLPTLIQNLQQDGQSDLLVLPGDGSTDVALSPTAKQKERA